MVHAQGQNHAWLTKVAEKPDTLLEVTAASFRGLRTPFPAVRAAPGASSKAFLHPKVAKQSSSKTQLPFIVAGRLGFGRAR